MVSGPLKQVRPRCVLRPRERVDSLTPSDIYRNNRTMIMPRGQGWEGAGLAKLKKVEQQRMAA